MATSNMSLKLTGDWNRAGIFFQNLAVKLNPAFQVQMQEDSEFVLETIKGHIENQDLGWTPLSESTVELKGGDTTIYVETGTLLNGLSVRKVKSKQTGSTFFIGASPWKRHEPSGAKLSDLMIWLEYGTDKIPPRPLIQPTYEEVESILKEHWRELLKDVIEESNV